MRTEVRIRMCRNLLRTSESGTLAWKPPMSDRAAPDVSFLADTFKRIAAALERLAPRAPATPDFAAADAFVWHPEGRRLTPIARVNRVEMSLLKGIDRVRDMLVENTER